MKRTFAIAVCCCFLVSTAGQVAAEEIGLKIGDTAPDFTLRDQNNKEVKLSALLKNGPVALVFYRSASW